MTTPLTHSGQNVATCGWTCRAFACVMGFFQDLSRRLLIIRVICFLTCNQSRLPSVFVFVAGNGRRYKSTHPCFFFLFPTASWAESVQRLGIQFWLIIVPFGEVDFHIDWCCGAHGCGNHGNSSCKQPKNSNSQFSNFMSPKTFGVYYIFIKMFNSHEHRKRKRLINFPGQLLLHKVHMLKF